jgi:PAS domain S-box-containing protein
MILPDGSIGKLEIFRDITERIQMEDALKNSETEIKSIFRAAPIGIGVVSGRIIQQVNNHFCEITGYPRAELIGQSARMVYSSDEEYEHVGREKYRMIKENGTGTVETYFRCKNGKIIDVLLSSTPIDLTDLSIGVTFTALDISDRKKSEKALKESRRKYRLLADYTYDWEYWIDQEGNYVYISPSCERITGYSPEEFISNPQLLYKIVSPDYAEKVQQHYNDENNPKTQPHSMEFPIIHKTGKELWIEHHCNPIFDSHGDYVGRRGNNREVTDRKKAEDKLRSVSQLYESIVDSSPVGIGIYNSKGDCVAANNQAADVIGGTKVQLLQQNYHHLNSWKESGLYKIALNCMKEKLKKRHEIKINSSFEKILFLIFIWFPPT